MFQQNKINNYFFKKKKKKKKTGSQPASYNRPATTANQLLQWVAATAKGPRPLCFFF
jgi:hypothetical protein